MIACVALRVHYAGFGTFSERVNNCMCHYYCMNSYVTTIIEHCMSLLIPIGPALPTSSVPTLPTSDGVSTFAIIGSLVFLILIVIAVVAAVIIGLLCRCVELFVYIEGQPE